MAGNIQNIINHREDILKAEIISWFALMDKTKIDWWRDKDYLIGCEKDMLNYIYLKAEETVKHLFADWEISIDFFTDKNKFYVQATEFIDKKWRKWRNINLQNDYKKVLQVLYGLGEGLNSGIDKGAPKAQLQNNKLWISNAFGSISKEIKDSSQDNINDCILYDKTRESLAYLLKSLKNNSIRVFRNEVLNCLKIWLRNLLADSRYPVNDITLWEQTFMPSTMFKATLAGFYYALDLDPNEFDHRKIKWSILGIQYDKLGLAEKGLKVGNIQWYREIAKQIDAEVRQYLELEFPIGNEIYRDETGVYFLISDKLNDVVVRTISPKINSIFGTLTDNEFFPYIVVSEPSRGLMQLTTLLQQAKENFLKAPQPRVPIVDFSKYQDQPVRGVCQVCGMRLGIKDTDEEGETYICEVCRKRKSSRIEDWLNNLTGETIWTGELRDKNDRIALVTLKFGLQQWLNGEFLSTMVENIRETYHYSLMVETLKVIKNLKIKGAFDISYFDNEEKFIEIESLILPVSIDTLEKQFDKNSGYINRKVNNRIRVQFDFVNKKLLDKSSGSPLTNSQINSFKNKISNFVKKYSFKIFKELSKDAYNSKDVKTIDDLFKQIFFGNVIDTTWKDFIKQNLFGLFSKLDFENQIINFKDLTEQDIIDLSRFILQFLLRKNPSPARLYRIWNNTKEFLEEVKNELIYNILNDDDRKRLIWNLDDNQKQTIENALSREKKGYLYAGDLQFWYQNGTVYQISYNDLPEQIQLKTEDSNQVLTLQKSDAQSIPYKPYFAIIDPTPISWQFIIPADKLPDLINLVQQKYNEHFHWVYGKLPLHIGVIIQDYKRPLYVGIKALRQIRRDGFTYKHIEKTVSLNDFKQIFDNIKTFASQEEIDNDAEKYYSLYFGEGGQYEFYFPDLDKNDPLKTLGTLDQLSDKVTIYPNTFDFEFLDSNARRNDIYYIPDNNNKVRRYIKFKNQRPINLDEWDKYKEFKRLFSEQGRSARLHRLISLLYKEIDEIENLKIKSKNELNKEFLKSAFVNSLRLNSDTELRDGLKQIINYENITLEAIKQFLDMFELWHTALKQV